MNISAFFLLTFSSISMMALHLHVCVSQEVDNHIKFIIEQRLREFANYPYLYRGTLNEELEYLTYLYKEPAILAIAYENEKPVGFITGTSFVNYSEHFSGSYELFKRAGFNPADYYYCSEVIVAPEHQGKGIARQLFAVLENHALAHGYKKVCFVCETHPEGHPQKPVDYRELDPLWRKLGYEKTDLHATHAWPTIQPDGTSVEQVHAMRYWIKDLMLRVDLK